MTVLENGSLFRIGRRAGGSDRSMMRKGSGRRVASVAGLVALSSFGVAAWVFWSPLTEWWYLRQLESEDYEARLDAAIKLAETGSAAGASVLARAAVNERLKADGFDPNALPEGWTTGALYYSPPPDREAPERSLRLLGGRAIPALVDLFAEHGLVNKAAYLVSCELSLTAPEVAVPALVDGFGRGVESRRRCILIAAEYDAAALPYLADALESRDAGTYEGARHALNLIDRWTNEPATTAALDRILGRPFVLRK